VKWWFVVVDEKTPCGEFGPIRQKLFCVADSILLQSFYELYLFTY